MLNTCLDFINLCQVSDVKLRASITNKVEEIIENQADIYDPVHSDNDSLKIEQNSSDHSTEMHLSETKLNDTKRKRKKTINKKGKKQQCSVCGRVMSST